MIKIANIEPTIIELEGVKRTDEKFQKIMDIFHTTKHKYLHGYPSGRKTRKKNGERLEKWIDCPGICFSYTLTDDTAHDLAIRILVSDPKKHQERYTQKEIEYFAQMFTQDIADSITALD